MRITSGLLRGRQIQVPRGIRPTQDRVRQAIFSALGESVVGARVLDLFAGSGSLGLEAISRGAARVIWVEVDPAAASIIRRNVAGLCTGAGSVVCADVFLWLRRAHLEPFDLVFADPPYDPHRSYRWLEKTLPLLEERSIVRNGGLLIFEMSASEKAEGRPGWDLIWDRRYGGTRVSMFRRQQIE
ncbi:MAG: 16S rRNA (guanine(966)-N(2))-methyltransferase RsmD [Kiritimatiellae bacterium]|nr:16S rRNA (guanine(966)-N(2))-methyltransferase RsmD [Kiritimatiellia bacterium]MDW8458313.1 16S rRNA (guanine(966)-N(2))-methyltransferase RsmD [Verrucomicrobiota bacterium]